jgi:organic radical activating enzyme
MDRAVLDKVEFYITNVCNYNCEDCNRLNNFFFSGHQYWKDHHEIYREWSTRLDIKQITILGGEPLLNPSLLDWIKGLRDCWPDAEIMILTNGTRLEFWPNLYNVLKQTNTIMAVNLHNRDRYKEYRSYLTLNFFKNSNLTFKYLNEKMDNWVDAYTSVKDESWPVCTSHQDFKNLPDHIQHECENIHNIDPETFMINSGGVVMSDNNINVALVYSENFWTAPLKYSGNNQFDVYNSDPVLAHNACESKYCHHFIRGKLYKCHHVALLPEFMEQFYVNINDEDTTLLNSYRPLTVDQSIDTIKTFVNNLPNQIPQCKLCPESLTSGIIKASTNKIKILKRNKIKS